PLRQRHDREVVDDDLVLREEDRDRAGGVERPDRAIPRVELHGGGGVGRAAVEPGRADEEDRERRPDDGAGDERRRGRAPASQIGTPASLRRKYVAALIAAAPG